MSKLLWVAMPLLLATAWVAVLALRGRLPPRLALNVWFSLLLLAYLLSTAGLGIFWVANQHLPVFDWHYLFGYATVLLLLLHLVFNFRVVWRHLLRPRAPAEAQPPLPRGGERRGVVGAMAGAGLLAAAGVGYLLGLRHGRTELRIDLAGASPASSAAPNAGAQRAALAVVEQFHEFSAHSRLGALRRAPGADWGERPPPFKRYPSAPRVALPLPRADLPASAAGELGLAALGAVLWHTAGVSEQRGTIAFRTSPSSGALFATELYVAARAVAGLASGVWHYDARDHALHRLSEQAPAAAVQDENAAAHIVATAIFRRSGHKYRDRTYRYVLADLGHALENLRAAAQFVGLSCRFARQFDEARAAATLGIDEADEGVLAWVALAPAGSPATTVAVGPGWQTAPLPTAATLGVTEAIHRATSLRAAPGVQAVALPPLAWTAASATESVAGTLTLPPPRDVPVSALKEIARRRSTRRYAGTPLALADLSTVLHAMLRIVPPVFSSAVRVNVVAHAVDGLDSGAWRYEPGSHSLHRRHAQRIERTASRRAALDQDVIGDAAAVFVLAIDRAAFMADAAGAARGYRHAYLETGLVGERIYLQAGALGLGVCAVGAFYDDEASALVGVDPAREWVVHFAALGVRA
jgi:SagB-type dehydrogenase family enzyme